MNTYRPTSTCLSLIFFFSLCTHSAQSQFVAEELSPILNAEVRDVFFAPYGGIFMKNFNMHKSSDDGESWRTLEFEKGSPIDIHFFSDGSALFTTPQEDYIYRPGESYQPILEADSTRQHLYSSPVTIWNDDIIIFHGDSIYKSLDRGLSFSAVPDSLAIRSDKKSAFHDMEISGDNLLMRRQVFDTALDSWVHYVEGYNEELELVFSNQIEVGGYAYDKMEVYKDKLIFSSYLEKEICISDDNGISFECIPVNSVNDMIVIKDKIYFSNWLGQEQLVRIVPINNFSENNIVVVYDLTGRSMLRKDHENNLIIIEEDDIKYTVVNTENYSDIKQVYPETEYNKLSQVEIGPEGEYYVSSKSHLYRSTDKGQTWKGIELDKSDGPLSHFLVKSDGGFATSHWGFYGPITTKFYDAESEFQSSLEVGSLTFEIPGMSDLISIRPSNCDDVGGILYTRENQTWVETYLSPNACLGRDIEPVFFNNKIYFAGYPGSIGGFNQPDLPYLFTSLDLSDKRIELNGQAAYGSTLHMKQSGEIFYTPTVEDFPLMYAPHPDSSFVAIGKANPGRLIADDKERLFIYERTDYVFRQGDNKIYFQENFSFDFKELEIENVTYEYIKDLTIKNDEILFCSTDGRTFRINIADLDPLLSSTKTIVPDLFKVYPNPALDVLNISFGDVTKDYSVSLIDINGQVVLKQNNESVLDIEHLTQGTYLLSIIENKTHKSQTEVVVIAR